MSKPHKWAKEIHAWADGEEIQWVHSAEPIGEWKTAHMPNWNDDNYEYRIKPQPKEPQYLYVYTAGNSILQGFNSYQEDLNDAWKYIGKIKLETDDE